MDMDEGKKQLTEAQKRRKRVNLYKKIIIIFIIALIILPTLLCIILFVKMNGYKDQVNDLKNSFDEFVEAYESGKDKISDNGNAGIKPSKSENGETSTSVRPDENGNNESLDGKQQVSEESRLIEQALKEGRRVVYLTFDDGPCANTGNLLDVLDSYGVKATFFVNGHQGYEDYLKRIVNEGHTLALHTYSHDYSIVYADRDSFADEIETLQDYLYNTTGVRPVIFRFPGGSSTSKATAELKVELLDYLNEKNLTYFDWNVSSGDGANGLTSQDVYNNVINGIHTKDISVVLMHDATYRESTFEAVPEIIKTLQAENALILPISTDTEPIHHTLNIQ